ncbi:MAG: hypothetical protein QW275_03785 [Candidatus Anstonellaceae archaeon]
MKLQELSNPKAALALIAGALGALGILVSLISLAASLFSTSIMERIVLQQISSFEASAYDLEQLALRSAQAADEGSSAMSDLSEAFELYANSSEGIADSISAIGSLPLVGSKKLSDSAFAMRNASDIFSNASLHLKQSSASISEASFLIKKSAKDINSARSLLGDSAKEIKNAFLALYVAEVFAALALCALFFSVCLLSASILLQ